jgi:hypothetical protein
MEGLAPLKTSLTGPFDETYLGGLTEVRTVDSGRVVVAMQWLKTA